MQDEQTSVQMATQGCGFVTIVGGTFLLHTTKDMDLTGLHVEEMVRQPSTAAASTASLMASSIRERRGMQGSGIELGKQSNGVLEPITVAIDVGANSSGSGAEEEQHPLLVTATSGSNSSSVARKVRPSGQGLFGWQGSKE